MRKRWQGEGAKPAMEAESWPLPGKPLAAPPKADLLNAPMQPPSPDAAFERPAQRRRYGPSR
ncbi:hypothetical protein GCM10007301_41200 [Azorhizobium oxalatiphilum]|uniref:Uncharacterized protein n=1 Tax=Azorhizobium oxalatiphilum TaxID=980631 RepID=A0A917C8N1_9HYPH|nr:hypothetical protein GCM10007301_41200 [Azorhizobium oxalatiphilum]